MTGALLTHVAAVVWLASAVGAAYGAPTSEEVSSAPDTWSAPEVVFSTPEQLTSPVLVTDSTGDLHAVFAVAPPHRRPTKLMYARLHDGAWSTPVVILEPGGTVAAPVLALDSRGYLHMIYEGPHWAQFEYRHVHVSQAADPQAWTRARTVSDGSALQAALIAAPDERLYALFSMRRGGIYYRTAQGRNWSGPKRISGPDQKDVAPDFPRLARDGHGRLHAVWTMFHLPKAWPPMGAYYSRSLDDGETWSPPRQIAGEGYGQANVVARGDDVHVAWNAVLKIGERVHSWSSDGGETWSEPALITTEVHGGWTGDPSMAFDGDGGLHLITAVDGPSDVERVMHFCWNGSRWSEADLVPADRDATSSREHPQLAIGRGNELHVMGEGDRVRVWHTEGHTAATLVPVIAVPTPGTGWREYVANSSLGLRAASAVLLLLGLQAAGSAVWRLVRRERP